MTPQGVGQWADKAPHELVRVEGNRRKLLWPGFMVWYRQQLLASRASAPDYDAARTRKMTADAELAELDIAERRRELITVDEAVRALERVCDVLRAGILAFPGRVAARAVGLSTIAEAQAVFDEETRALLGSLSTIDIGAPSVAGDDAEEAADAD